MRSIFGLTVLFLLVSALPAAAQEPRVSDAGRPEELEGVVARSGVIPALDSIAASSGPELQEALDQLAVTLGRVVERIASDPELRASTLRAAGGMVELAQVVVAERSDVILEALRTAAERLSEAAPREGSEPAVR